MTTYLVLNYAGAGAKSNDDWTALFRRLEAAKALRGGSALGSLGGGADTFKEWGLSAPASDF